MANARKKAARDDQGDGSAEGAKAAAGSGADRDAKGDDAKAGKGDGASGKSEDSRKSAKNGASDGAGDKSGKGGGEGAKDAKQDGQKDEIKVARTRTDASLLTNLHQRQAFRRARGLGASGTGAAIWTAQRLTALALIPLALWFLASLLAMLHAPAPDAARWFGAPWNAALVAALVLIGLRHATIGFRVILEDYVHSLAARTVLLALLYAVAALSALAAVTALLVLVLRTLGG